MSRVSNKKLGFISLLFLVLAVSAVAIVVAVSLNDSTSSSAAQAAEPSDNNAGSKPSICGGYVYGQSEKGKVQYDICRQDQGDFEDVKAKNLHRDGRVVYSGLKGHSESEKIQKMVQYSAEDPVVTASMLECLAPGTYNRQELDKLAKSEPKSGTHWKYHQELRSIVANPNFTLKGKKLTGVRYNEGRTAAGDRTSTATAHNGTPANEMRVPTMETADNRAVKGGKHTALERCNNCQTKRPVGVVTPSPGAPATVTPIPGAPATVTPIRRVPGQPRLAAEIKQEKEEKKQEEKKQEKEVHPITDETHKNQPDPHSDVEKAYQGPSRTQEPGTATPGDHGGYGPAPTENLDDKGGKTQSDPTQPPTPTGEAIGPAPAPNPGLGSGTAGQAPAPSAAPQAAPSPAPQPAPQAAPAPANPAPTTSAPQPTPVE